MKHIYAHLPIRHRLYYQSCQGPLKILNLHESGFCNYSESVNTTSSAKEVPWLLIEIGNA